MSSNIRIEKDRIKENWVERKNFNINRKLLIPKYIKINFFESFFRYYFSKTGFIEKTFINNSKKYTYHFREGSLSFVSRFTGDECPETKKSKWDIEKSWMSEQFIYKNDLPFPDKYKITFCSYSNFHDRFTEKTVSYFLDRSGNIISEEFICELGCCRDDNEIYIHTSSTSPFTNFPVSPRLRWWSPGKLWFKYEFDNEGFKIKHYQFCIECGKLIEQCSDHGNLEKCGDYGPHDLICKECGKLNYLIREWIDIN